MANPYTSFGFTSNTDESGQFNAPPEETFGTKSTGKTKRRNPYTLFGFGDTEQTPDTSSIDRLLDQKKSLEDISKETGYSPEEVRAYTQQNRPDYGVKKDKRNFLSKAFDTVNVLDSGRSWGRADPSVEGAQKSVWKQGKETGSAVFSGVEKVGDSIEALTGITDRRMKHWDEELRKGNITREVYQKLLENQMKDTEWAGSQDKGLGDRLKTAAGVGLEATSEIVPFLKVGKAAQLTLKGGAAFGAATGLAHGTGSELNNPEGFDWKNVAIQTAVGGATGGIFGKVAQNSAETRLFIKNQTTQRLLAAADNQIEPITDVSRLLSATTQSTRTGITSRISEINSKLDDIRTGKTPNTTYEPNVPTMDNLGTKPTATNKSFTQNTGEGLAVGERGVITPSSTTPVSTKAQQLRTLVKERDSLTRQLDLVESGSGPLERVSKINDELLGGQSKGTLTPQGVDNLVSERQTILDSVKNTSETAKMNADYIEHQTNTAIKNQALIDPNAPSPDVPTATKRAAKMADVTEDLPTAGRLSDEQQTTIYGVLKDSDPEYVKDIALGKKPPPQGVTAEFIASQEANTARATKNGAYGKELARSPVFAEGRELGQRISSFRTLDQESPITAMKKVMEARVAAKKNGATLIADISDHEAQAITDKSAKLTSLKDKYLAELDGGVVSPKTRYQYGQAKVEFDKYVHDLMPGKTIKEWVKNPASALLDVAGTSKSLRATLDVSGILRQGAKVWATHPTIAARNSLKSLRVAVKSFGDENVMDAVNANLVSRKNYLNGVYKKIGVPVYDVVEEAFPSATLNRLPFLRKLYNASDTAYTSLMHLNRADLADYYVDKAVKAGVDLNTEGKAIGNLVNSLSSRGGLGSAEKYANAVNNVFFSPRLMKSNFDVLGGHVISGGGGVHPIKGGSNFVRKEAATNLLKIAGTMYAILKAADAVRPNSVEWDPRSSNYGKIKVGNTRFDVTGGMSSLVTLGARLSTGSAKSSTTDIVSKLDDPDNPFSQTTLSTIGGFAENKLSPAASALQDIIAKEDFNGKKPTIGSTIRNLTMPIVVDNFKELSSDKNAAPLVASMILEGLGVSTNTYDSTDDWEVKPTAAQKGFKGVVGDTRAKVANELYNQRYTDWFREIRYGDQYGQLSDDARRKLLRSKSDEVEKQVMAEFGYTYKAPKPKKDTATQNLIDELKKR